MARLTVAVLRRLGGAARGLRAERVGLPHGGGRHVRPARRPAPVLLAPDARPPGRGASRRPDRLRPWVGVGLAWGGALLSKYHAVFLPAGALLYLAARALGPAAGCGGRGLTWRSAIGLLGVLAGARLERRARLGLVRLPGGPGGRRGSGSGPTRLAAAIARAGGLPVPLDLAARWWSSWSGAAGGSAGGRRPADRFLLCQSVVPAGGVPGGGLHPAGPAALDARRLPLALPAAGPVLGRRAGGRPGRGSARRLAAMAAACRWRSRLVLRAGRTGARPEGAAGRLGLLRGRARPDASTCTAGTRSAAELRRRGLLDRPGTFLFTSSWYQQRPARLRHPRARRRRSLCYNPWDARSFAFWSRPEDWVGRDGILVAVNEHADRAGLLRPLVRADRAARRASRSSGPGRRSARSASSAASARPRPSRSTARRARPGPAAGSPRDRRGRPDRRDDRPSRRIAPYGTAGRRRLPPIRLQWSGTGRGRCRPVGRRVAARRSRAAMDHEPATPDGPAGDGPVVEGRRALPDVPAAEPRALLPRRRARPRRRPELHPLGRLGRRRATSGSRTTPTGSAWRSSGSDPLPVPAGQPDAVPARRAAADRDDPPGRSTSGSAACSTPRRSHRVERFQYALEDLIVTDYLDPPDPFRVPAALEALRVAALSTYENRRVSTGALLLGTDRRPGRCPAGSTPRGRPGSTSG